MHPSIYIVTPTLDAAEGIDRTILSVAAQAGGFAVHYHVQDGGSADGTLDRLRAWERRFAAGDVPVQCAGLRFSFASGADGGPKDAILRGFARLAVPKDGFMTWVNAGDVLLHGALARVAGVDRAFAPSELSWLGGASAVLRDDMTIEVQDRGLPTRAIRGGLCDGVHWPQVQQAGTFFRRWLWDAVKPGQVLGAHRLAADWALWRAFAQKASLVQVPAALAACRVQAEGARAGFLAEIEAALPLAERRAALAGGMTRRALRRGGDGGLRVVDEAVDREEAAPPPVPPDRPVVAAGGDAPAGLLRLPGLMGMDAGWQYPAVTEQHAFACLSSAPQRLDESVLYVAFPWATLIDKVHNRAPDADAILRQFEALCAALPPGRPRVTVCQHIFGRRYERFFRQAGIGDVFWSHATHEDGAQAAGGAADVRFHPFPLYPVQTPEALPEAAAEADAVPRRYLFSFIGARANKFYLTQARNWVLDLLADDPRGLVRGRDSWHYQRVVYDLQVRQTTREVDGAALVDSGAAAEFRDGLVNSTFALCPSGSGPNSIRLWEALAAGSVPVILADTWAPPGDRRLWDMAAVFCDETPEAVRALPDRLAAIAAEPGRLARMRHAMRQLWLLYGPPAFVTDLRAFILDHAAAPSDEAPLAGAAAPVVSQQLLIDWGRDLLLDPGAAVAALTGSPGQARALAEALAAAGDGEMGNHLRAVLAYAQAQTGHEGPLLPPAGAAAPAVLRAVRVPKVCLYGRHAHRTPLAYPSIRRLVGGRVELVREPGEADLVVTGFDLEFRENFDAIRALAAAPGGPKLAVLSEEPLWDVTWSRGVSGRQGRIERESGGLDYTHLGHGTSGIYAFVRLPYYVVAEAQFLPRYAALMARQARRSAGALLAHWHAAPVRAAFLAERRTGENYRHEAPSGSIVKLSAYRTELAERMQAQGALCMGKGWQSETRRQDLPDWHLDKLAWLHDRCWLAGAQENIHQAEYVSEKIFDAFACGAVPVYFAGPGHRVFELVAEAAMVNTYGMDVDVAAARLTGLVPDGALADAWLETCRGLAALCGDMGAINRERARMADAVVAEVARLL